MGLISSIAKKVKKVGSDVVSTVKKGYSAADTAVKGYLPGGTTPTQVKEKEQIASQSTKVEPSKIAPTAPPVAKVVKMEKPAATVTKQTSQQKQVQALKDQQKQQDAIDAQKRAEQQRLVDDLARQKALEKPGGWKNVANVLNLAVNPFAKGSIEANTGNETANKLLEAGAEHPFQAALFATGVTGIFKGVASAIASSTAKTAVSEAGKVGVIKTIATTNLKTGVETVIRTNTVTAKATASLLTKMVGAVKDPKFIVGGVMAVIGSYPFAGFIKEEALQTLGFGVKSALDNNDIEGAKSAIDLQKQILNPGLWDQIKSKIPFVNVIDNLNDFYKSAAIKLAIDEQVVSDLKTKIDNGETDTEMYARIQQERDAKKEQDRIADEEYYANIEALRKTNKEQERKADEEYWNKILADRDKRASEKQQQEADYWNEYYKTMAKYRDNSAPSNLKFGLL
jgi:hypothetical protein